MMSAALYIPPDVIRLLFHPKESFLELSATYSFIYWQVKKVGYNHHVVVLLCG